MYCIFNKILYQFLIIIPFITSVNSTDNSLSERRFVEPPQLTEIHLGKKILCHRPMRRGTPNMTIEELPNNVIAHNYGHGGSGWTLAPGCAQYVVGLLESSQNANDLKKDTPITIIGAGTIGLFTAYDLVNKNYTNITVVAESFEDLTSHNAGGLLAPVSMDNDPKMQMIINRIGINAYEFYKAIALGHNKTFVGGAVVVPTYFRTREESGLEPYVGKVMQPAKDVILDFGNGTTQKMVAYDDGIFIDTGIMMKQLKKYLTSRVKFQQKKITKFTDIQTKYIINCSGLGSKELIGDKQMVSVQGHLIMLKDQKPQNLQHMILIYLGQETNKHNQKVKRSFYMFPKRTPDSSANDIGVIGGTFIEDATSDTPNNEEFDIMLQGAKNFYGIN